MNGRGGFGLYHMFLRRCEKKKRMMRVERRPHSQRDHTKDPSARIFPPGCKNPEPPRRGRAPSGVRRRPYPEVSHTPRSSPEPRQSRPRRLSQIFGPAGDPDPPPSPPGSGRIPPAPRDPRRLHLSPPQPPGLSSQTPHFLSPPRTPPDSQAKPLTSSLPPTPRTLETNPSLHLSPQPPGLSSQTPHFISLSPAPPPRTPQANPSPPGPPAAAAATSGICLSRSVRVPH